MANILLIAPNFESDFSIARNMMQMGNGAPRTPMVPLQHATIAALTPDDFQVDIWDEGFRGVITETTKFRKHYDLVGVTGYMAHLSRAIELADLFRKRGVPVAIGGPGVSGNPETCRGHFDVMFLGEAELTWPRFLRDWTKGSYLKEYRQVERIDMSSSPRPRWDSIARDIRRYELAAVQTTRGCPFDCEFCDVIHLFGRKPRHKPIDHVIEEVVALQKLGAARMFLCDDDFVGDMKYAKQLVRELVHVNNSFPAPLGFTTQATINAAADEELLELMADANFFQLHIGIETPRAESLKEAHKLQNLRIDLAESCRKIQSYGIGVRALMIVGFDADDKTVFEEHRRFIEDAHIPGVAINTLKAYRGTPLWLRLQQEERVLDMAGTYEASTKVVTNIIPKNMSRVELLEGYRELLGQVRSWDSFERRVKGFVSAIRRRPRVASPSLWGRLLKTRRLLRSFLRRKRRLPPDVRAVYKNVVRHTFRTAPYMLERVIGMLIQQTGEAVVHPFQCQIIQKQIDDAIAGNLKIDRDPSAGTVPPSFKRSLREVLPDTYDRLAAGIQYKPAVPEAMVDVLKDFLIRWGATFQEFEPHHRTYLRELCDRHIERWNARTRDQTDANGNGSGLTTGLVREQLGSSQFIQALLASVEQDLRAAARSAVVGHEAQGSIQPALIQVSGR